MNMWPCKYQPEFCGLHRGNRNVCRGSNSRPIWNNGDDPSGGNACSNRYTSDNDTRNSNASSMVAMDSSMMGSNPNTMKSAIHDRREGKYILPPARLQFQLLWF